MSEINIKEPFLFLIEVAETDDYLPSFMVVLNIGINHPTGLFKYSANDIWFECSKWDAFEKGLVNPEGAESICLEDMSEQFSLKIVSKKNSGFQLELLCSEPETGMGATGLSFSIGLSADELAVLSNSFKTFPKWW